MSSFCGKCDFADTIEIHGLDFILNKCKVYDSEHNLLKLDKVSIIKYYPYIVGSMGMGSDGGSIILSKESYVDTDCKRMIEWAMNSENDDSFLYTSREFLKCVNNDSSLNEEEKKIVIYKYFSPSTTYYYRINLLKEYLKVYKETKRIDNYAYELFYNLYNYFKYLKKYGLTTPSDNFSDLFQIKKELYKINGIQETM